MSQSHNLSSDPRESKLTTEHDKFQANLDKFQQSVGQGGRISSGVDVDTPIRRINALALEIPSEVMCKGNMSSMKNAQKDQSCSRAGETSNVYDRDAMKHVLMQGSEKWASAKFQAKEARNTITKTTTKPSIDEPLTLTAEMLAAALPGMQKQMLGEKLFPAIARHFDVPVDNRLHEQFLVGKITGMMLEMNNSELLVLLESDTKLVAKIEEAKRVLDNHQSSQRGLSRCSARHAETDSWREALSYHRPPQARVCWQDYRYDVGNG